MVLAEAAKLLIASKKIQAYRGEGRGLTTAADRIKALEILEAAGAAGARAAAVARLLGVGSARCSAGALDPIEASQPHPSWIPRQGSLFRTFNQPYLGCPKTPYASKLELTLFRLPDVIAIGS